MRARPMFLAAGLGLLGLTAGAEPPASEPVSHFFGLPPRLGIELQAMTPELRDFFQAPRDRGVLVVRVDADGPAAAAGVRVGDVVIAVDDEPVEAPHDLALYVASAAAEKPLVLEVVRRGKRKRIEVTPEGEPLPFLDPEPWSEMREHMRRGLHRGRDELRRRLQELERRIDELERRLQERELEPGEERT